MTSLRTMVCAVALCSVLGCSSGGDQGSGGSGGTGIGASGAGAAGTVTAGGTGGTTAAGSGGVGGTDTSTGISGTGGTGTAGTDVTTGGTGGTGTAGTGIAGTSGTGGGTDITPVHEDLGEGDGQDVVMIGDSYMSFIFGQGTQFSLEAISGRNYREYSVPGTHMLNGEIPNQYMSAKNADPDIKTVIMTGGGNDIIASSNPSVLTNCVAFNQACMDEIAKIQQSVEDLMTQMAADGVEDVIYIGYSYTVPPAQDLTETSDYSRGQTATTCLSDGSGPSGLRCHFVDPIELSTTTPPVPIGFDGIHPTKAGYDQIAGYVWDRMQAEGVRR